MKLIRIENNTVKILCPEIKKKIDKMKLSPSFVGSWLESPGDWVMNRFIMEKVQVEETPYLERGKWFHSIMEDFFGKPAEERTFSELKKSVQAVSNSEEYAHLLKDEDHKEWLKRAIKQYYTTWGENAPNEKIATVYLNGEQRVGLELFVNGKIGEVKRQCLGFIDRIIEGEMGLIVQDWKSGKKVSTYDPSRRISGSNPFDYWRQQLFYTILLEQKGMIVEGANLIFPCPDEPTIVDVDVTSQSARRQVIKDCETVDKELDECIENDYTFPFKAGKYNSWATYLFGLGSSWPPKIYEDKLMMLAEIIN